MLPLAAINVNQVQVPIINTVTPGTTVTHVPYDNVAPSVSNAQVDNNASSNNAAAPAAEPPPAPADTADTQAFYASLANGAASTAPGAQATFLTQLIAQDLSPPVQTILMQYEKLVAFSNVKYKPSNAFRPEPAPSGEFGRILQQESPPVQSAQPLPAAPAPVSEEPAAATTVQVEIPVPKPVKSSAGDTRAFTGNSASRATQISGAYTAAATRAGAPAKALEESA
jgi:hypothetical protein